MDFKKIKTETTVVTRQKDQFYKGTGNIYETVAILSIRANQIASEMKAELNEKIESFASARFTSAILPRKPPKPSDFQTTKREPP